MSRQATSLSLTRSVRIVSIGEVVVTTSILLLSVKSVVIQAISFRRTKIEGTKGSKLLKTANFGQLIVRDSQAFQ